MAKGDKSPKEERETGPQMTRAQELVGTARERTTTISGNTMKPLQPKSKENNFTSYHKTRYGPNMIVASLLVKIWVCCRGFELAYSDVMDQRPGQTVLHIQKEMTHDNKKNDKTFNMI
jgi:hypothetical protein